MNAILATPLRVERAAVRPAARSLSLVRTGIGRAATLPRTDGPVLIAGVGGGLAPQVRPGDLVVAGTVTADGHRVELPSAPLLARALRHLGLTVHYGHIGTTDRIATGDRRKRLASTGALAVDLESATLAAATSGPVAVVRSIVDTEDHALWALGTVGRGVRALRALRVAVPAFEWWAAAIGRREILRGVSRGADLVLVVGSDSRHLVDVSRWDGARAHLVEDVTGVDLRWLAGARRIGVVADASVPPEPVEEVIHALSGLDPTTPTTEVS
ncbi:phosphorylase family protein [Allokutzneria oryzae]|uniref:Nucleoside phosphorylase domain-containing protein n=1 Tax=Allokutzneria oryzae TaxID=1378989 RepID=A0ABV5ZYK0_9PSEU